MFFFTFSVGYKKKLKKKNRRFAAIFYIPQIHDNIHTLKVGRNSPPQARKFCSCSDAFSRFSLKSELKKVPPTSLKLTTGGLWPGKFSGCRPSAG